MSEVDELQDVRRDVARRFGAAASLVAKTGDDGQLYYHIGRIEDQVGIGLTLAKTYGCGRSPEEAIRDAALYFRQRAKPPVDRSAFATFADYQAAKEARRLRRGKQALPLPAPRQPAPSRDAAPPPRRLPPPVVATALTHADHIAQREADRDDRVEF